VGLFTGSLTIPGGICADKFSVYVEDLGTFLNLGDMCVATELVVQVTRVAPYVSVKVSECTLDVGILGSCACVPCVVGGLPGYSAACVTAAGGGGGFAVPCTPLAIPLFRTSGKTDVKTIADSFNLDDAIEQRVEEYKKEVAAAANKNEENTDKDEDRKNQINDRSDCHNGLCDGKRDQNEDRNVVDKNKVNNDNKGNDKDSDVTTGGGNRADDKDTDNINGGNTGNVPNTGDVPSIGTNDGSDAASALEEPGSGRPKGGVGWGIWDSVRNFFS